MNRHYEKAGVPNKTRVIGFRVTDQELQKIKGNNLRCKAGLPDLQVKDLRTFFNWLLGTKSDLSNKELGRYIGNTERVNLDHYTPYSLESSNEKLSRFGLSQWIPGLTQ